MKGVCALNLNVDIRSIAISLVALLLSIDVHEFAHAWAAYRLGDDTAQRMGRLTLNPLAHLDPVGTIMMLVSSLAGFGIGWGKPVPYNPRQLRVDPRTGGGLVSVAGPASNLLVASLVAVPLRLVARDVLPDLVWDMLVSLAWINILLAVFNLLPVPPLDGHAVLLGALSAIRSGWAERLADRWERLLALGPGLLIILIMVDRFLPARFGSLLARILWPPASTFCRWIFGSELCIRILTS